MAAKRGPDRPKPLIGYVRVSTAGQAEQGISLEVQRDAIRAFADSLGAPLLEIFEDVASGIGLKSFPSRLGLQRALGAVRDLDGTLVVWDWSRLSRHAEDAAEITALLPADDRIISVNSGNAFADAVNAGQLMHTQRSGERIAKRTRDAMQKQKAEGAVFGNPNILEAQRLGAKAMSAKHDALVQSIADVLRDVPNHEKLSRAEVADYLNARGIVTGAGSPWTAARVTTPLKKARLLLSEDEAAMKALPTYGLF